MSNLFKGSPYRRRRDLESGSRSADLDRDLDDYESSRSLSNLTEGANGAAIGPGLGDIPESCVACVFTYLTPPEICNLARLNHAFRGAASSDSVWEKKLPRNYLDLLDLLPPDRHRDLSKKKDIYALLSRPVPFDDGNKVFFYFILCRFDFPYVWIEFVLMSGLNSNLGKEGGERKEEEGLGGVGSWVGLV
ncbi:unnamed protein product [Linum trigynum]|uniref:F-box domain-containing protein n=1 Tax=Linum trigynum TaxID=586398 RepID=A0AAV2CS87_9ROSI